MRYSRATRWISSATVSGLALASAVVAATLAPQPSDGRLFQVGLRAPIGGVAAEVVRSEAVVPRLEALGALRAGDGLVLNLFDDVQLPFTVERRELSGVRSYRLYGQIDGDPNSSVIIVSRDGHVAGLVRSPGAGTFQIRPARGLRTVVQEIDEALIPSCGSGPEHAVPGLGGLAGEGGGGEAPFCGAVRIDVLMVYSPEAREAAGSAEAIEAIIDLAIADTNLSYVRSEVGQRVNVVHIAETEQSESGFFTGLSRLRLIDDGFYDEVHPLRDEFGADMVAMLIADQSLGGIAYLQTDPGPDFDEWAFSVTNWLRAPLSVLAHELGHNMGCAHDRDNASGGAFPYSFGYRYTGDSGELWRTVMAYAPGVRIQNFSNPEVIVDGQPTGVLIGEPLEADNHETLNQTAAICAAFRDAVVDVGGGVEVDSSELIAPVQSPTDFFGFSVAIDGALAVVGAPMDGEAGADAGAAYVYRFDGETWLFEEKLIGSQTAEGDRFGRCVAVSGDTVVVGSFLENEDVAGLPLTGVTYVFRQNMSPWIEEARLTAETPGIGDQFGVSCAIDGDVLVVGADLDDNTRGLSAGSASVFRRTGTVWSHEQTLLASDGASFDGFGLSVAVEDQVVVVGSWMADPNSVIDAGAAYIYRETAGNWVEEQKLEVLEAAMDDQFGYSVAIDGNGIVVGAWMEDVVAEDSGGAYVYAYDETLMTWTLDEHLFAGDGAIDDQFGVSVALSNGATLIGANKADINGIPDAGAAYVFRDNGQIWFQEAKLTRETPSLGDELGIAVALSGDLGLIGAWAADGGLGVAMVTEGTATIDCNLNGVPDGCDLVNGSSTDCNGNGVPDECDIEDKLVDDVDGNGVPDDCEDCNRNGVPDGLDIAVDPEALDCNGNDVLDQCEVGTPIVVTSDLFSPFGFGDMLSLTIPSAPNTVNDVFIEVTASGDLEQGTENVEVQINGAFVGTVFLGPIAEGNCSDPPLVDGLLVPAATYNALLTGGDADVDLVPSAAVGALECKQASTLIFSVEYTVPSLLDVNANQIIDACEDCNGNKMPDLIDIITGFSEDCNDNGIPDECEPDNPCQDCNENGIDDTHDIVDGFSADCNDNAIPDECDIADGTSQDIDGTGIPDECECPADCQEFPDGNVDVVDLLWMLGQWGATGSCDMVGPGFTPPDGEVSVPDLLFMLGAWGACEE